MPKYSNLVQMIATLASKQPDKTAIVFHQTFSGYDGLELDYRGLWSVARSARDCLSAHGVERGDRVVLLLPNGVEFMAGYFGALLLGAVPVPCAPAFDPRRAQQSADKVRFVFDDCGARHCLTLNAYKGMIESVFPEMTFLGFSEKDLFNEGQWGDPDIFLKVDSVNIDDNGVALIQYTSGSTSDPKGATLSHANLVHNLDGIYRAFSPNPEVDRSISWLPLYHDMGLIGMVLSSIYAGIPVHITCPLVFVKKPDYWFQLITDYRCTITSAPNFALGLCIRRCRPENFDLSSLRVLMNGAEPINCDDQRRFAETFAPSGFKASALTPGYGLAETCVAVSFCISDATITDRIDQDAYVTQNLAKTVPGEHANAREVACVGKPIHNQRVRIVAPDGSQLAEGMIGEIEVSGPAVMAHYYGRANRRDDVIRDGWLRTGDLGYLKRGLLYITGRLKDVIIYNGKNWYPQDIERDITAIDRVKDGKAIVFWVEPADDQKQGLVALFEVQSEVRDPQAQTDLITTVRHTIQCESGLPIRDVRIVGAGEIPLTSSGKVRRQPAKQEYLRQLS